MNSNINFRCILRHGALHEVLLRPPRVAALPAPPSAGAPEHEPYGQRYSCQRPAIRVVSRYIVIPEIPEIPNETIEESEEDPQSTQPEHPHQPDPPKSEPFWQNPQWKWRSHPAVLKYDDEAFIFISADAFPTDSNATAPLIAWLRQPGKMCSPSRKEPLPSGVVRVEDIGWVVTLGHMPGAIDRMARLLEKKAGQVLIFKGKRFSMAMDIHMPLEWMP